MLNMDIRCIIGIVAVALMFSCLVYSEYDANKYFKELDEARNSIKVGNFYYNNTQHVYDDPFEEKNHRIYYCEVLDIKNNNKNIKYILYKTEAGIRESLPLDDFCKYYNCFIPLSSAPTSLPDDWQNYPIEL